MVSQHLSVVHLINVVAGQDQYIFGIIFVNEVDILIDGVGRALVPLGVFALGIGRQDLYAAVPNKKGWCLLHAEPEPQSEQKPESE